MEKGIIEIFQSVQADKKISAYALFRYPNTHTIYLIAQQQGQPLLFDSIDKLEEKDGFVIAPFEPSKINPIILFTPDIEIEFENYPSDFPNECILEPLLTEESRILYKKDFQSFIDPLKKKNFDKIVLSRNQTFQTSKDINPETLFLRACNRYPRQFVALYYTETSGLWLTATPEVLLEGKQDDWHTISLAGTMPFREGYDANDLNSWSDKDKREQAYVTEYIASLLKTQATNIHFEGPYVSQAGNVMHLRTDFHFSLPRQYQLSKLLKMLHPTPAVCGLPKVETREHILKNESKPRKYYAGFIGVYNTKKNVRLFVSLRCMQIEEKLYHLYAGGGLLGASEEENEWKETEDKMHTMKSLFQII